MMSALFVVSGAKAVMDPDRLAGTAVGVTDRLGPRLARLHPALPSDAASLVRVNGALQVTGGLLLNTALHRPAAMLLAGTMVPTTLTGHPFWRLEDPAQRAAQRTQFLKNLSVLGGLLLAAADTGGSPGLPWRTRHALHEANRSVRRTARTTKDKTRLAYRAASLGRRLPG